MTVQKESFLLPTSNSLSLPFPVIWLLFNFHHIDCAHWTVISWEQKHQIYNLPLLHQHLEPFLEHKRCTVCICWMSKWRFHSPFNSQLQCQLCVPRWMNHSCSQFPQCLDDSSVITIVTYTSVSLSPLGPDRTWVSSTVPGTWETSNGCSTTKLEWLCRLLHNKFSSQETVMRY